MNKKAFVIVALVVVCLLAWPHLRRNRQIRQFLRPDTYMCDANPDATAPNLHWEAAQKVLNVEVGLEEDIFQAKDDPIWQSCGLDYLRGLSERRQKAIAFSHQSQPSIIFVGIFHGSQEDNTVAGSDAEAQGRLRIHHNTTVKLVVEDSDVDAFLYEGAEHEGLGRLEPMTREYLLANFRWGTMGDGTPISVPKEEVFERSSLAFPRIMGQRPDIKVVPGEECPLQLSGRLMKLRDARKVVVEQTGGNASEDCQWKLYQILFQRLRTLRTEIIIIRALEVLEQFGGNKAAIEQGAAHVTDLTAIQKVYGFPLKSYDLTVVEKSQKTTQPDP